MERYCEYKDSGVQWLGEIPSHWKTVPFKSIFDLSKGLSITKANLVEKGVNVVSYGQIHSKQNRYTKIVPELYRKVSFDYLESNPQSLCKKDDFLIADTSEDVVGSGNFVRVDKEQQLFAGYHTIIARNKKVESGNYIAYLMQSDKWRMQIWIQVHGVKLYSISRGILNATKFLLPPLVEQNAIVSYLDTKCSNIETLLANKEKEITLLQEMKQRVIANAVTRGLNPNVKFKPTNISWLLEIPEHWKMSKVSSHFRQRNEKVSDKEYRPLSVSKIGVTPQLDNVALSNAEGNSRKLVKVGDYAVNSRSDRKGSCGISRYEGSVSLITIVLEPFDIDGDYVHYLFRSNPWVEEFYRNGRGIVADLWTTNYQMMKGMYLPVPPISEQHAIVSYITERTSKIDSLIEKLNKEIECIKEYKQRLISDVVTGQIKVS